MKTIRNIAFLFLCGCAVNETNVEIHRVGELEIRLYENIELMRQEVEKTKKISIPRNLKLCGFFDNKTKIIFSLREINVILHELRHYLEPDWRHEIGTGSCKPSM